MNAKLSAKALDSSYFRVLFELAKEEGLDALLRLLEDLKKLEKEKSIGDKIIFSGVNPTVTFEQNNKKAILYLRKHASELDGISLLSPSITRAVKSLVNTPKSIDTYLKNARLLEQRKIKKIEVLPSKRSIYDLGYDLNLNTSLMMSSKRGTLTDEEEKQFITYLIQNYGPNFTPTHLSGIIKLYSDGEICYFYGKTYECSNGRVCQHIPIELDESVPASWILKSENYSNGTQTREMYITSFAFDASRLPSEEEIERFDIPQTLKLELGCKKGEF